MSSFLGCKNGGDGDDDVHTDSSCATITDCRVFDERRRRLLGVFGSFRAAISVSACHSRRQRLPYTSYDHRAYVRVIN